MASSPVSSSVPVLHRVPAASGQSTDAGCETFMHRELQRVRASIDPLLEQFLQLSLDASPRLNDAMRYALLAPGKRLRPALVFWAADACSGGRDKAWEAAAPAAVAVEMIHAYSLVHDDLPAMDDDDLRRGRPTCHRAFDEATAILCGDALQALAFETLARDMPSAVAAKACLVLAQAVGAEALVGGQSDDLAAERGWIDDLSAAPADQQMAWLKRIHWRNGPAPVRRPRRALGRRRCGAVCHAGCVWEKLRASLSNCRRSSGRRRHRSRRRQASWQGCCPRQADISNGGWFGSKSLPGAIAGRGGGGGHRRFGRIGQHTGVPSTLDRSSRSLAEASLTAIPFNVLKKIS